jgi:5-(carboxyamino)imidazole ribonucleotide mutase
MGSDSDWPVMRAAAEICRTFAIGHEVRVISAHRSPLELAEYARTVRERGLQVVIAGAGGAAHLPGVIAAATPLPVIGVPVAGGSLQGLDALLSIVQMPRGVPVATVAIGGAANAGLLAVQILALQDGALQERFLAFRAERAADARAADARLRAEWNEAVTQSDEVRSR